MGPATVAPAVSQMENLLTIISDPQKTQERLKQIKEATEAFDRAKAASDESVFKAQGELSALQKQIEQLRPQLQKLEAAQKEVDALAEKQTRIISDARVTNAELVKDAEAKATAFREAASRAVEIAKTQVEAAEQRVRDLEAKADQAQERLDGIKRELSRLSERLGAL